MLKFLIFDMKILAVFILVSNVAVTVSMSCGPCSKDYCLEEDCHHGSELDMCSCCTKCLKGPGESCGGMWNHNGNCAEGLKCVSSGSDTFPYYGSSKPRGICQKE
ncbi:UNVERIFIED_CONTAM: hypothetical protein RMT77_019406 [Armadillidium vulgare]